MPKTASSPSLQTRRSGRITGFKEEGNVRLERPAEGGESSRSGRARRKVEDEDERGDILEFPILISTSDDAYNVLLIPGSYKRKVEKVEEQRHIVVEATELEGRGTLSQEAPGTRPSRIISWATFTKASCASNVIYGDPYPCDNDTMVIPTGPKRQNSIHPRVMPKANTTSNIQLFDLTSSEARGSVEPAAKRRRTDLLDFPYTSHGHPSNEPGTGTYERHNVGQVRIGSRSAASSVNPEPHRGDLLVGFQMGPSEFRNLNNMLHGSGNIGGRRYKQHDQSRGSSRQHTLEIPDDDSDPIMDDGPGVSQQPKQQPGSYTGTANTKPARTRELIAAANKPKKRPIIPDASPYFRQQEAQSLSGSQRPMIGGGNAASTPRIKDRMQDNGSHKRNSDAVEDISDDDALAKRPKRGSRTGQVQSNSLSQAGNIPSSFGSQPMFKKSSEVARERAEETYLVSEVKTSQDCFMATKEDGPACFSWRQEKQALHLCRDGHDLHPTLAIGMNKIQKITCSFLPQYDGLFLIRQLEPYPKLMLVRLNALKEAEEFLMYLQKISPGLKDPLRYTSDQMERVFQKTSKELDQYNYQQNKGIAAQHEFPEDIRLLESRKSARFQNRHSQSQGTERTPGSRKTLVNSMIPESKPTRGRIFDGGRPRISPSVEIDRPTTRSTRNQQIELHRSPSPRLELWTKNNRGWREKYWKGDEPLIYPETGDKRATVDRQDIERLNEGEFLNDNLLQFYLRYLEEQIKTQDPDVAKRVLFMNPFFYQRLTKGKGRSHIDYDGVKRWTAKFDIFEYDYVIVPVNEHAHWYLAVICNTPAFLKRPQEEEAKVEENDTSGADTSLLEVKPPSATAEQKAEAETTTDVEEKVNSMSIDDRDTIMVAEDETATTGPVVSPKQKRKKKRKSHVVPKGYKTNEPRIITMDSLGYPHSPTCTNLKEFLIAEAKARKDVDVLRERSVGMTAKNIPEQNNHCDCGLFLLGYVQYFLENPDGMMHDLMQQKPEVAERFAKLDASKMRGDIRQLLFDLKKEQTEREQAEKDARIAKRRAEKASEGGDSLPPTTEPTPTASPETSGGTSSNELKTADPESSQKSSTEPLEDDSLIEVRKPATPAGKTMEKSASPKSDFMGAMDQLAGFQEQEHEPQRQRLPHSQSVELVEDRPRLSSPFRPSPYVKQKRRLPTSKGVEYVGTKERSSPLDDEAAFAARKALHAENRRRNTESLTSNSDSGSEPEITSVKKMTTAKASMSPVPASSAFKGPGQKFGKIGPPGAARDPSSDQDAPPKRNVVDLGEESDDLPSQPRSRELRRRLKQSLPPTQQQTPSRKPANDTKKSPSNAKEDAAVDIPVKKFTPQKPRLSEGVSANRRSQRQTQTTNDHGGTHTKFGDDEDDEDEEMLMGGERGDSLMRDMSPETLRSSATKQPAVEITPGKSRVDFSDGLQKSIFGTSPKLPVRLSTSPQAKQNFSASSPSQAVRSLRTAGRGRHPIAQSDPILREKPTRPPPPRNSGKMAASSPGQGRSRTHSPTTKVYKPSGGSRQSSRAPDDKKKDGETKKGGEQQPIVLD